MLGVAAPHDGRVAVRLEPFGGVLADGLEQAVPDPGVVALNDDERLVDELRQHVVDIEGVEVVAGEDDLGRGEVATSCEHRQAVEGEALG